MVDLGIDTSIFEKAAALLARPLSPTAREKEQQLSERPQPAHFEAPRKSVAKAKAKAKSKAAPSNTPKKPAPVVTTDSSEAKPKAEAKVTSKSCPPSIVVNAEQQTAQPPSDEDTKCEVRDGDNAPFSILGAVSELSDLQKDWKEKMNSPSYRKPAVPRVNRKPEPKTLTDDERNDKLLEINALEQQLEEAKGKAAAVTAAAEAAAEWVAERAAQSDVKGDGASDHAGENLGEPQASHVQAEERVKARRRQEALERRKQERREAEARQVRQSEAEAKAKELERLTKERMHLHLREAKEKQQLEHEEAERRQRLREERAAASEELRQQAANRVVEREHAERRKAMEIAEIEAEQRQRQETESEMKLKEGRERNRLRMQQRAQELAAKRQLEEEAERRRFEYEAARAAEQSCQAQLSQQRARARAAEFKQRALYEEEECARLDAERLAIEQAQAEAVLVERQRKRHWRAGDPHDPSLQIRARESPSPSCSSGGRIDEELDVPSGAKVVVVQDDSLSHAPPNKAKPIQVASKVPTNRASRGDPVSQHAARVPPRPPGDRSSSNQNAKYAAGKAPKGQTKSIQQSNEAKATEDGYDSRIIAKEGRSNAAHISGGSGDEPIRCTVGFFGAHDVDFLGDDDDDDTDADAAGFQVPVSSATKSSAAKSSRESTPSRCAIPQQVGSAPKTSGVAPAIPRAYSQPPPSRPPAMRSSRADSPASRDELPNEGSRSPGAISNRSDPAPRAQACAWKQKAISVQPAEFYLNKLRAARGRDGKPAPTQSHSSPPRKSSGAMLVSESATPNAWDDPAFVDQTRLRARAVEATQRQEEGARQERGYAALQRVQQRAAQAPSRSNSTESGRC
jgi:hypothetical protein